MRQGFSPVALGLIADFGIALGFPSDTCGTLYGITAADPIAYFSVCVLMFSIADVVACILAHRTTRVVRWPACEMNSYCRISWARRF